jgi:hypothetical protein
MQQLCGWEVVVEWDDIFGVRIEPRFSFPSQPVPLFPAAVASQNNQPCP